MEDNRRNRLVAVLLAGLVGGRNAIPSAPETQIVPADPTTSDGLWGR